MLINAKTHSCKKIGMGYRWLQNTPYYDNGRSVSSIQEIMSAVCVRSKVKIFT